MRVHIIHPPEVKDLDRFKSILDPKIILSFGEIQPEYAAAKLLVAGRPTLEQLGQFPDLEAVIVPWTGISLKTLQAVREVPGLKLHNLHHNSISTAELAVGLLFSVAKRVIPFDQKLRQGNWELRYQDPESRLLAGKKALIIGYGEIGKYIARILRALTIEVKAIKRTIDHLTDPDLASIAQLPDYLSDANIIILALPLTQETEGLIGKQEMALIPEDAILINVSRGQIIDQKALYSALKSKKLFGAGLDVWYNYPEDHESRLNTLPGDYPFHKLENVVLSPHRAGLVKETEELRLKALADLLNAAAKGERMPNQVNLDLGY